MNWKSVLATALPLFLAATGVAIAQEATKKTGSDEAVRLFDEEGKALIDSLEKNFYGRDAGNALVLRGSAYVFSPTDPRDHLTTHFLRLPAGNARTAKISLSFSEPEPSGSNLLIWVQDGRLATIQQFQPHPTAGALSVSQDVSIPGSASTLRLAFLFPESKPTNLPNHMKIECVYSRPGEPASSEGRSAVFYVVLAVVGIAGVAAILRLMKIGQKSHAP